MQRGESIGLSLNTDYDRRQLALSWLHAPDPDGEADCFIAFDTAEQELCAPQHCTSFARQMKTSSCMNWMRTDNWFYLA